MEQRALLALPVELLERAINLSVPPVSSMTGIKENETNRIDFSTGKAV